MVDLRSRNVYDLARGALSRFPVVVIQGVRRAGKSTLAEMLVAGTPHRLITLDDDEARAAAIEDPRTFLEPARAGSTMVIDEVQRVPGLVLAIKAEVDARKAPARFVLTGSSDLASVPGIPDSLAGRAVSVRLRPFSQGELAGRQEDFAVRVLDGLSAVADVRSEWHRADYARAAWGGGYPELLGVDSPWRELWLDSYTERLTSRDAQSVVERVAPARVRAVLRLLAANQAGELVKARIAQDAGISANSVTTCLDVLGALFLTDLVPPLTASLRNREVGRPKTLIADSGLAAHLAKTTADQLAQDTGGVWLGGALEGLVTTELLKQRSWSLRRWELFHYRDRNGLEVDAVLELDDGRVILIEVKSSATYRAEHFEAMKKLADQLGDRMVAGVVLSTASHGYRYSEKLVGLPISALWQAW
jgi:predicted AAA+ superfamily ATPase